MSERVVMDSDLLERVGRRLCKQGGATWPTKATPYAEAQRNAYQQLAWAAVDEVLAWQSEQSVAAAGTDPFWKRSDLPIPRLNLERVDPMPKEKRDG